MRRALVAVLAAAVLWIAAPAQADPSPQKVREMVAAVVAAGDVPTVCRWIRVLGYDAAEQRFVRYVVSMGGGSRALAVAVFVKVAQRC